MKKCPYCAEQINDEAKKCRYCKSSLHKNHNQAKKTPSVSGNKESTSSSNARKYFLGAAIVVIAIVATAFVTSFIVGDDSSVETESATSEDVTEIKPEPTPAPQSEELTNLQDCLGSEMEELESFIRATINHPRWEGNIVKEEFIDSTDMWYKQFQVGARKCFDEY